MKSLWNFQNHCWNSKMIFYSFGILLYLSVFVSGGEPPSLGKNNDVFRMAMPNVTTSQADSYLCTPFKLDSISKSPIYVTGYRPAAEASKAHHMLLQKCNVPYQIEEGKSWDCLTAPVCRDPASIIYGWAKNADSLKLPDGVSFTLDPSEIQYLVLQVHYADTIESPDTSGLTLELSPKP